MLRGWQVSSVTVRKLFPCKPPIKAEHKAERATSTVFQVFDMIRPGVEPQVNVYT